MLRVGRPGPYKGKRCRVLAMGSKNSVAIEFEDGHRTITSGNCLMRATRA